MSKKKCKVITNYNFIKEVANFHKDGSASYLEFKDSDGGKTYRVMMPVDRSLNDIGGENADLSLLKKVYLVIEDI